MNEKFPINSQRKILRFFIALLSLSLISASSVTAIQGTGTSAYGTTIFHKHELSFSSLPELNKPAELTLEVTPVSSFLTSNETIVKIELPEGFEYISGDLEWRGTLRGNQTVQLKAIVKSVKTGDWKIKGWVIYGGSGVYSPLYVTVTNKTATTEKSFSISRSSINQTEEQVRESLRSESVNIPSSSSILQQKSKATSESVGALASTITVTGYWKYNHQDGSNISVRYQKVILKEDVIGPDPTIGDPSYTTSDGKFTFTDVPAGKDLYVEVHATFWNPSTDGVYVTDGNLLDMAYWGKTTTYENVGSNLDMGTWVVVDAGKKGAWHIYDKAVDAYLYLLNEVNDRIGYDYDEDGLTDGDPWNQPKIEVIWPKDETSKFLSSYKIYIEGGDEWKDEVIQHEYGHAAMHKAYWPVGNPGEDCPEDHFFDTVSNPECAFKEGWAEFLPGAIQDRALFDYNLENTYFFLKNGASIEGAAAGVWYDLYDSSNSVDDSPGVDDDSFDTGSGNIADIWDTLIYEHPTSIVEFRDDFISRGHGTLTNLWFIYDPQGMDYDTEYSGFFVPLSEGLLRTSLSFAVFTDNTDKFSISHTNGDFTVLGTHVVFNPQPNFDVYVYSDSGMSSLLASSEYQPAPSEYDDVDFVILDDSRSSGTHYVKVTRASGESTYVVETEKSTSISVGSPYSASFSATEVLDVYKVSLDAGTKYLISASAPDPWADINIYLFDDTGGISNAIAKSDSSDIGAGESFTFTPSATGYYAIVVTNKNGGDGSYTVSVSVLSTPRPDLTLTSSDIAWQDTTSQITATIHNTGDANASNVLVEFFNGAPANNDLIGSQTLAGITAGDSQNAVVTWNNAPGGTNPTVYVVIDSAHLGSGAILESDEGNNIANKSVSVPVKTTYVSAITLTPDPPDLTTTTTITATITNNGGSINNARFKLLWAGPDRQFNILNHCTVDFSISSAESSIEKSCNWDFNGNTGQIFLKAELWDWDTFVLESALEKETYVLDRVYELKILEPPEFYSNYIDIGWWNKSGGDPLITNGFYNIFGKLARLNGSLPSSGDYVAADYGNWSYFGKDRFPTDHPTGDNFYRVFKSEFDYLPDGMYFFGVIEDEDGNGEMSTTDREGISSNSHYVNFHPLAPTIDSPQNNSEVSGIVTIGASSKTNGIQDEDITKMVFQRYEGGSWTDIYTDNTPENGFFYTEDVTNVANYTERFIRCQAFSMDGSNVTSPSVRLIVSSNVSPDLVVYPSSISFNVSNPNEGDLVIIYAQVFNIGNATANYVKIRFYLGDPDVNGTQIGLEQTITSIGVGNNGVASTEWNSIGGSHDIYVVIDPQFNIFESREDNNEANKNIRVNRPPITPTSLTPVSGLYNDTTPIRVVCNGSTDSDGDQIYYNIIGYYDGYWHDLELNGDGIYNWDISSIPSQTGVNLNCSATDLIGSSSYFNPTGTLEIYNIPPIIDMTSPPNESTTDTTPNLNLTTNEPANITYSWDSDDNISGCRNCTSYNTTYGESVPETNTSLLLHFNEDFGNVAYDDSGHGNDGDISGTSWTAGRFGQGLKFNATAGDVVSIQDAPGLDGTKDLTVMFWAKWENFKIWGRVLEKTNAYFIAIGEDNRTYMQPYNDTGGFTFSYASTTLQPNTWYFVAGVYDSSTGQVRMYIDGMDVTTGTTGTAKGGIRDNANDLCLGARGTTCATSSDFNGTLDEVHMLDRALNATEIFDIYNKALSDGQHNATVYAKDKAGNVNSSVRLFFIDTSDNTPPTYSNDADNSEGSILEGDDLSISVYWDDNFGLDTGILRTNKTGTWVNETFKKFTATPQWFNTTIGTVGFGGKTICWDQIANDTSDNRNNTMSESAHCFEVRPRYIYHTVDETFDREANNTQPYWWDSITLTGNASAIVTDEQSRSGSQSLRINSGNSTNTVGLQRYFTALHGSQITYSFSYYIDGDNANLYYYIQGVEKGTGFVKTPIFIVLTNTAGTTSEIGIRDPYTGSVDWGADSGIPYGWYTVNLTIDTIKGLVYVDTANLSNYLINWSANYSLEYVHRESIQSYAGYNHEKSIFLDDIQVGVILEDKSNYSENNDYISYNNQYYRALVDKKYGTIMSLVVDEIETGRRNHEYGMWFQEYNNGTYFQQTNLNSVEFVSVDDSKNTVNVTVFGYPYSGAGVKGDMSYNSTYIFYPGKRYFDMWVNRSYEKDISGMADNSIDWITYEKFRNIAYGLWGANASVVNQTTTESTYLDDTWNITYNNHTYGWFSMGNTDWNLSFIVIFHSESYDQDGSDYLSTTPQILYSFPELEMSFNNAITNAGDWVEFSNRVYIYNSTNMSMYSLEKAIDDLYHSDYAGIYKEVNNTVSSTGYYTWNDSVTLKTKINMTAYLNDTSIYVIDVIMNSTQHSFRIAGDTYANLTIGNDDFDLSPSTEYYLYRDYLWDQNITSNSSAYLNFTVTLGSEHIFDLFDNYRGASIEVTTTPTITIILPQNGTYNYNESIPLNFTLFEPKDWCGYSLDGAQNVTIPSCQNTTFNVSEDGPHNITIYANDSTGQMNGTKVVYFTVDTIPPTYSNLTPSNNSYTNYSGQDISIIITDTVSDVNAGSVSMNVSGNYYDTNSGKLDYDTNSGLLTYYADDGEFNGGQVVYVVAYAEDNVGNQMDVAWSFTVTITEFNTSLIPEWNMISIPLEQDNWSITSVLAPIEGNYTVVFAYINGTWEKSTSRRFPMTNMSIEYGYWINMSAYDTLELSGTMPSNTTIDVIPEWNLVGYPTLDTRNLTEVLSTINYTVVFTYIDGFWHKSTSRRFPMTNMTPGYGYWINATEYGSYEVTN